MLIDAIYSLLDLVLDSPPVSIGVLSIGIAVVLFYVGR
jgi:hypothetical protein